MSRAARLSELNNVECVSCGSVLTRSRGGGRSSEDHRIRRRVCDECGQMFCTVELPLLYDDGTPVAFGALVPDHQWRNRVGMREQRGYHATRNGRRPYVTFARIVGKIRVRHPVRAEGPGPWPAEAA